MSRISRSNIACCSSEIVSCLSFHSTSAWMRHLTRLQMRRFSGSFRLDSALGAIRLSIRDSLICCSAACMLDTNKCTNSAVFCGATSINGQQISPSCASIFSSVDGVGVGVAAQGLVHTTIVISILARVEKDGLLLDPTVSADSFL